MKQLVNLKVMKGAFFYIILTCIFLLGCKKDPQLVTFNTLPKKKITINGYTAFDAFGNQLGLIDSLDWQLNSAPPDEVDSTFNVLQQSIDYSGISDIFLINQINIYPNPFIENFTLNVQVTNSAVLQLLIVDEYLNEQAGITTKLVTGNNSISIALANSKGGTLYRVYYRLLNNNRKIRGQGFGDIKKL
jgi:hypothetical protein